MFIQIAEGLKYIHSQVGFRWGLGLLKWLEGDCPKEITAAQDIVYRDLKPENILVDPGRIRCGVALWCLKMLQPGNHWGALGYSGPESFKTRFAGDQTVRLWTFQAHQ